MSEAIDLHFKFILYSSALPIISALVNNNIAERLGESAKTAEELCESTNMQPEKLFRFLRLVSSLGLFSHDRESNKWSNTKSSSLLMNPISHSLCNWIGNTFVLESLIHAETQLSSSKLPMETLNRPEFFDQIVQKPELFQTFQNCMTQFSRTNSNEVAEGIIIEENSKVLDVGGADGTLVIELAKKYQNATFGVFERPELRIIAEANIERNQLVERVKFYAGDFFDEIQSGFDCIIMKHVIHDWDDEKSALILKNCRKVLREGDKLFIVEHLLDENAENYSSVLALDYMMLMNISGKERTALQFKQILDLAGFELVEIRRALFQVVIETKAIN